MVSETPALSLRDTEPALAVSVHFHVNCCCVSCNLLNMLLMETRVSPEGLCSGPVRRETVVHGMGTITRGLEEWPRACS